MLPGGHISLGTRLIEAINNGTSGHLRMHKVQSFGSQDTRTFGTWKENSLEAFECRIGPVLLKKYPETSKDDVADFKRKWEVLPMSSLVCLRTDIL